MKKVLYLAGIACVALGLAACKKDKGSEPTPTPDPTPIAVTGITLDKNALELEIGGSYNLKATVTPENATDKTVTFSTDKASIASVDASGKVTAIAAGTANITAKAGDKTATCVVTVKAAGPEWEALSLTYAIDPDIATFMPGWGASTEYSRDVTGNTFTVTTTTVGTTDEWQAQFGVLINGEQNQLKKGQKYRVKATILNQNDMNKCFVKVQNNTIKNSSYVSVDAKLTANEAYNWEAEFTPDEDITANSLYFALTPLAKANVFTISNFTIEKEIVK